MHISSFRRGYRSQAPLRTTLRSSSFFFSFFSHLFFFLVLFSASSPETRSTAALDSVRASGFLDQNTPPFLIFTGTTSFRFSLRFVVVKSSFDETFHLENLCAIISLRRSGSIILPALNYFPCVHIGRQVVQREKSNDMCDALRQGLIPPLSSDRVQGL